MEIEKQVTEKIISVLKDPFNLDSIKSFRVSCHKSNVFDDKWYFTGSVEFKKGKTAGKQEFEGVSFEDVVLQLKAFFGDLEK
jgi:hypothetical protein